MCFKIHEIRNFCQQTVGIFCLSEQRNIIIKIQVDGGPTKIKNPSYNVRIVSFFKQFFILSVLLIL